MKSRAQRKKKQLKKILAANPNPITPSDFFGELVHDIKQHQIDPRLDLQSFGRMQQVSRYWCGLLSHPASLMLRIESRHGIKQKTLREFDELAKKAAPDSTTDFARILKSLEYLAGETNKELKSFIKLYSQSDHHLNLLACCVNANYGNIIKDLIPRDEIEIWAIMSVAARAHQSIAAIRGLKGLTLYNISRYAFMSNNPNSDIFLDGAFIDEAAHCGNLQVLKRLINTYLQKPTNITFAHAIRSGNLDVVNYLLTHENAKDFAPSPANDDYLYSLLSCALESGNLQMVFFLQKFLNLNLETFISQDDLLLAAANSGNQELCDWLIVTFNLPINQEVVCYSALSDNPALTHYFINVFQITPHDHMVEHAAERGHDELVKGFTNSNYLAGNGLKLLNRACSSDNLELVKYIVNTYNVRPNNESLAHAMKSRNIHIARYLLSEFGLTSFPQTSYTFATENFYYAILSFDSALRYMRIDADTDATNLSPESSGNLHDAASLSPRVFFACAIKYVLAPDKNQMHACFITKHLLSYMQDSIEDPCSLIEREAIKQMLMDSGHEQLQRIGAKIDTASAKQSDAPLATHY